jgi:quercetin dioxygenase-like cupin family protein
MRPIGRATTLLVLAASLATGAATAAPPTPAVTIHERLVLDNESVRVAFLTFPPGAATGPAVTAGPEIRIVVDGEIALITRRGKEALKAGSVVWLEPATAHETRTQGRRPARLWALALKRCE